MLKHKVEELERLSQIASAVTMAFNEGATLIVSINAGEPIYSVDNVDDLIEWQKEEVLRIAKDTITG